MNIYPAIFFGGFPGILIALALAPSVMWQGIFVVAFCLGQGISAALCWKLELYMDKFVPRVITRDQAEKGYNNEGRGKLIGYVAVPNQHEKTCRYRLSTGGNPDKSPHEACTCRLGLWQEKTPAQKVVDEIRKTSKRRTKPNVKKPKYKALKKRKATGGRRGR